MSILKNKVYKIAKKSAISSFAFYLLLIFFTVGCRTTEIQEFYYTSKIPDSKEVKKGIYHKVGKGETLWRIAKTYDKAIEDIVKVNNIPDVAQIENNQLIFIPGASEAEDIILDTENKEKDFIWPIKGKVIKYFNTSAGHKKNKGIDIKATEGQLVKAARTGRVVFADKLSGYGKTVILDHRDGYFSVYANNSKLLVALNNFVLKNKEIAYAGTKNQLTFLHFEIRKNSKEENPFHFLP